MSTNGETVRRAFDAWMTGTGYVSTIFDPRMTWEIVGHSAASARYATAHEFQDAVLAPFARRFSTDDPFRPVTIRGFYVDDRADTVIVMWDGEGTTVAGTTYRNTYAWFMTLRDGLVVDGTAFYDSISFNELWAIDPVAEPDS